MRSLNLLVLILLLCISNTISYNINNNIRINHNINNNVNKINRLINQQISKLSSSSSSILTNDLSRCDQYAAKIDKHFKWGIIGTIVRYLNICFVNIVMVILFRILNQLKIIRGDLLWKYLFKRDNDRPLLTISNHMSMLDDPGLMGAILPYWRFKPDQLRWSLCTEDFFFIGNGKMVPMFAGGNALPLDRSGSLEQPMFKYFLDKVYHLLLYTYL